MLTDNIILAVFTGTGNTLVAAEQLAASLAAAGKNVRLVPMEKPGILAAAGFGKDATLGLAVPVACFTTYPTVWRFIDSLPAGDERPAFLLATMGGFGAGMQGPIGRALERKGYRLLAAGAIAACGNYGGGVPPAEKREEVRTKIRARAEKFAARLLAGRGGWSRGRANPVSALFYWLGRKKISFRGFRRFFPVTVNRAACTGCGVCAKLCPEGAASITDGKAAIADACQSCQRCAGFCPAGAIGVSGKPARQYSAVPLDALRGFLAGSSGGSRDGGKA